MSITPQGYVYGSDPSSVHPFWEEDPTPGPDPGRAYIADVAATLAETDAGKTWTFKKTDNNGLVTTFATVFVPKGGGGGEVPDNVLTAVRLTPAPIANGVRYYISTIAADESETGVGTIDVPAGPAAYLASAGKTTGTDADTLTVTDNAGAQTSLTAPTKYLKAITHAGGQNLDTYTITDADGTAVTISTPSYYLEKITGAVDPTEGEALITQTGYVSGQEVTSDVIKMTLAKSGSTHTLEVQSNGDSMSDSWSEFGLGGLGGNTRLYKYTGQLGIGYAYNSKVVSPLHEMVAVLSTIGGVTLCYEQAPALIIGEYDSASNSLKNGVIIFQATSGSSSQSPKSYTAESGYTVTGAEVITNISRIVFAQLYLEGSSAAGYLSTYDPALLLNAWPAIIRYQEPGSASVLNAPAQCVERLQLSRYNLDVTKLQRIL